jgi:hypothetical protein
LLWSRFSLGSIRSAKAKSAEKLAINPIRFTKSVFSSTMIVKLNRPLNPSHLIKIKLTIFHANEDSFHENVRDAFFRHHQLVPFTNKSNVNINSSTWIGSSTTKKERKPVFVNFFDLFFFLRFFSSFFFDTDQFLLNRNRLSFFCVNTFAQYLRAFERVSDFEGNLRNSTSARIDRQNKTEIVFRFSLFHLFAVNNVSQN